MDYGVEQDQREVYSNKNITKLPPTPAFQHIVTKRVLAPWTASSYCKKKKKKKKREREREIYKSSYVSNSLNARVYAAKRPVNVNDGHAVDGNEVNG
jgi:hypothetical protein